MVYYLLFFELQIKSYDFSKIWMKSDSISVFNNLFESETDTWRVLVGAYRFGRIHNVERWILLDLDAPDRPVPVR
jgi:hypothetical protein